MFWSLAVEYPNPAFRPRETDSEYVSMGVGLKNPAKASEKHVVGLRRSGLSWSFDL
jgi:hypothetical protein